MPQGGVIQAWQLHKTADFIMEMPDGYDTHCEQRWFKLWEGPKTTSNNLLGNAT